MKNVVVFALGGERFAVELRWVREVVTLGYVTPVPTAPPAIAGAVNVRGTVTPVIDLTAALGGAAADSNHDPSSARRGDGAVLVEGEGVTAAIRVANVETVTTLRAGSKPDHLDDGRGHDLPLIDVPGLLAELQTTVAAARAPTGGDAPVGGENDGP